MLNLKFFTRTVFTAVAVLGFCGTASAATRQPTELPIAKTVHYFRTVVVKSNYSLYSGGVYKNKRSVCPLFHKTFVVHRKFSMMGQHYYYIESVKNHRTLGYVNKAALATANQSNYLKVPYVSQYKPVFTPWGCAGASMTMILRSQGKKVDLSYVQKHLPMVPTKDGQKGNVYTGAGFGHVIRPAALTKYAHRWDKNVINISSKKLSVKTMKEYIQGGKPVLYYGFSSYQKYGDNKRNHCKVITGYSNHNFRVYDPLYYSKNGSAGTGGKNMKYDRGAIAWVSEKAIKAEFNHWALTVKQ